MSYSSTTSDPYRTLGVPRDASPRAIKQAYRRIALSTHPDHNPGDAEAAELFRRASRAYALLRDPQRRPIFDRTGRWDDAGWSADQLDTQLAEAIEIFAREFGASVELPTTDEWATAHTGAVTVPIDITWDEVERGGRRRIPAPCTRCSGSGAREGSAQVRCTECGGSGRLRHVESSLLGPRIHTAPCEGCRGSGRRPLLACPDCEGSGKAPKGQPLDVLIPRGVGDGEALSSVNPNGTRLVARVVEDNRWGREGSDLYAVGRIPYAVAVLGGTVDLELPGRSYRARVAPGTASGHRARIPGEGLPRSGGDGRGDLILTLHVAVPERVGAMERWMLALGRPGVGFRGDGGVLAGVSRLQGRARDLASFTWGRWRQHHRHSSFLRIETAAASLRATAGFVSESEERLGPLLEKGFPLIAPEAAVARRRLDREQRRLPRAALATLVVDVMLVAALTAALWIGGRYAATPLLGMVGAPWWDVLRTIHPAVLAFAPLLVGLAAGAARSTVPGRWGQRFMALPLGLALTGAVGATGAACHAVALHVVPAADPLTIGILSTTLVLTIGIVPLILFLLGVSLVDSVRAAASEARERRELRTLRAYDTAAARLATLLEGMERGFRQLLARADDARRPLASLLGEAADALAADAERRSRRDRFAPALALGAGVVVSVVWAAAASMAVAHTVVVLAAGSAWLALAGSASIGALCALGSLLPPTLLERQQIRSATTGLATAAAFLAVVGFLTGSVGAAGAGWLAAAGATAALALSFRLPEAVRATAAALVLLSAGLAAVILWPVAALSRLGGRRPPTPGGADS
jgi:molecular chaperone DnaJ